MNPNDPYSHNDAGTPQAASYDFILNPNKPAPTKSSLPSPDSTLKRVLLVAAGLIVLLIIFSVVKGFLNSGSSVPTYVKVAQTQQQIIHLSTNALQEQNLSLSNKNFAVTTQASITSSQRGIVTVLAKNGQKVNDKKLNLFVSSTLDDQLKTASQDSTYNKTFKSVMQTKIETYQTLLKQAYAKAKSQTAKKILTDDYTGATLLLVMLNSPAN